MMKRFLQISISILLLVLPVDCYAAETEGGTVETVPLINWKPEAEVESYIPIFIESREKIRNIRPLDTFTFHFENKGPDELRFSYSDICLLKKQEGEWNNIPKVEKKMDTNPFEAYFPTLSDRVTPGSSIYLRMDVREYDIMAESENPTGHYAIAVYCYDADGNLTIALTDFFISKDGLVRVYEKVPYTFNDTYLDEDLRVTMELEYDEYPPTVDGFVTILNNGSNELQIRNTGKSLIKFIEGDWYTIPVLDNDSDPVPTIAEMVNPNAQAKDFVSSHDYAHELTDGRYAIVIVRGASGIYRLEFNINSSLSSPR
jgi:hypothetical protein